MKLTTKIAGAIALCVLSISGVYATSLESALKACQSESDSLKRLVCYDRVASTLTAQPATQNQQTNKNTNQPAPQNQPLQSKVQAPSVSRSDVPTSATPGAQQTGETNFGLNANPKEPDEIHSRIVGTFKGWKKGAILVLENGQRWKVISQNKGYTNKQNPKVVISKGFLGSFNIKAEGLNAMAKVRRID